MPIFGRLSAAAFRDRWDDIEEARMARLLTLSGLAVGAISTGLATSRFLLEGAGPVGISLLVTAGLFLLLVVVVFATGSVVLGGWLLPIFGLFGVATMSAVEARLFSEALFWLPFVPLVAVLTARTRGAIVCTVAALLLLAALLAADLGEHPTPRVVLQFAGVAGAVGFGGLLGLIYERSRLAALGELEAARLGAEAASTAKSVFLANMSHELRTPLNSIIGFSNITLKRHSDNLSESASLYLSRVVDNGKHLLYLINEILDLSRLEAGRVDLDLAPLLVSDVVKSAIAAVESIASNRAIAFEVDVGGTAELVADEHRLRQVVISLLANAVKFSEPGAVVAARLDCDGGGRPLRLDICDAGVGVPEEKLELIFEPFRQADESLAREHPGTGLGLSISERLCALMGFELGVVSRVGVGSVFSIYFDRDAPPPGL